MFMQLVAMAQMLENADPKQDYVVNAPSNARVIVDAGPGTGKTAVACARIAQLMNRGVSPANIWLFSFTRTAVAELRERIRELASNEAGAAAVRITTLDSHAWHLRAGFDIADKDALFSGYDENIESVIELLKTDNADVKEYFQSIEHLVVDEAQDLVGIRAELVETIIELLSDSCGITVFTDNAQAIYGFSDDSDGSVGQESRRETLPNRLRGDDTVFQVWSLEQVHRTESDSLKKIFVGTRKVVLDTGKKPDERLKEVINEIKRSSDGQVGNALANHLNGRNDTLVLFRRRSEVLTASSLLRSKGVQHRIRMSGIPVVRHAWIALLFWDYISPRLTRGEFDLLWRNRMQDIDIETPSSDECWKLLLSVAGERGGYIDMGRFRERLSRDRPPLGLYSNELGRNGPILGTIHASKGREAPVVHLMLPYEHDTEHGDTAEECRVVFVGATRARKTLKVGQGYQLYASSLKNSGRAFRLTRNRRSPRAQVEIGREGDIDGAAQVSRRLFRTAEGANSAQQFLRERIGTMLGVTAKSNADDNYRYELLPGGQPSECIGALSQSVNTDLFRVGEDIAHHWNAHRLRPRNEIRHLYIAGIGSYALSDDDPRRSQLHPPYDRSGIFLVPIVSGFSMVYFKRY